MATDLDMGLDGHTPGPWTVDVGARSTIIRDDSGHYLAEADIGAMDNGFERAVADLQLMAAAPMLFEGARDTVEALKLLHIGLKNGVIDEPKMIEVIEAHVAELLHAISYARGLIPEISRA